MDRRQDEGREAWQKKEVRLIPDLRGLEYLAITNQRELLLTQPSLMLSGSPKKEGESASYRKRRESFKARHAKNIAKGKMSAAYWADKAKW